VTVGTFAVLALLVLGWAVTSDLLARVNINGPLVFLVAGYALGNPNWGPLSVEVEAPSIHLLAEVTLALLLFSDASRVSVSKLRRDLRFSARLLGIGLPLSVVLGSLLAAWLLDDLTWALAGFVGATLAPTDAGLSAQVINDSRIPMRVRRVLNVESGLNDGIARPSLPSPSRSPRAS
jgi:sodium/hydrogen antiporter